jgi:hypothetical protein
VQAITATPVGEAISTVQTSVRWRCQDGGMDGLDQLDVRRHDSKAIVDAAHEFSGLTDAEQDEHLGLWAYAGMDDAQHPFTGLLREGHNETCVVRDLDGTLQLLWQETSTSDQWLVGPLFRENLIDDGDLKEQLGADPDWLADRDIFVSPTELSTLMSTLPSAPGPVMSF